MNNIKLLTRKRLIEQLINLSNYPITYVKGQIGKGKKVAVKQYLDYTKVNFFWKSFSINTKYENFKNYLDEFDLENEITLVIDNFHLNRDNQIFDLIIDTINNPRNKTKFILISRIPLPNYLYSLYLESKIGIMNPQDIFFTKLELNELLILNNIKFTNSDLDNIYNDTNGWIIAINEIIKRIDKQPYEEKIYIEILNEIYEYLDHKILIELAKESINFLIVCSYFDSFTIDFINYILGINNAREIIESINKYDNYLINDNNNYSILSPINQYFQNITKRKLININEEDIYTKAAEYYKQTDQVKTFIYYIKSKRFDFASRIIIQNYYENNDIEWYCNIEKYLSMLPTQIIDSSVILNTVQAISELLSFRIEGFKKSYDKLIELKERNPQDESYINEINQSLLFLDIINPYSGDELISKILIESRNNLYQSKLQQDFSYTLYNPSFLTGAKDLTLFIKNSKPNKISIERDMKQIWPSKSKGALEICYAENLYQNNRLKDALVEGYKGLILSYQNAKSDVIFAACNIIIKTLFALNRISDAEVEIDNMHYHIIKNNHTHLFNNYEATIVQYDIYLGNEESITKWLSNKAPNIKCNIKVLEVFQYMIRAKALIATNNYGEAFIMLNKLYNYFDTNLRIFQQTEVLVMCAICLNEMNDENIAFDAIEKALLFAQNYNYIRIVSDFGLIVYDIIEKYYKSEKFNPKISEKFITDVLRESKKFGNYFPKMYQSKNKNFLTKSELDVLKQLCYGITNEEISYRLNISLHTVKTHLKNIYIKMDVKNRSMAILKAKELKLL